MQDDSKVASSPWILPENCHLRALSVHGGHIGFLGGAPVPSPRGGTTRSESAVIVARGQRKPGDCALSLCRPGRCPCVFSKCCAPTACRRRHKRLTSHPITSRARFGVACPRCKAFLRLQLAAPIGSCTPSVNWTWPATKTLPSILEMWPSSWLASLIRSWPSMALARCLLIASFNSAASV